jgi:hypothetical protein
MSYTDQDFEAKHTPGPWKADTRAPKVIIWGADPNSKGCVALVNELRPDHQANAQLLAATPELLEALRTMVDLFDHVGLNGLMLRAKRSGWTVDHVNDRIAACRAARAAIAKAEGR